MIHTWRVFWLRPILPNALQEFDSGAIGATDVITFRLFCPDYLRECDPDIVHYRFQCMDCYKASGDAEAFVTGSAFASKMKDGPTEKQQSQMQEHARQHSIMWSWARSLK